MTGSRQKKTLGAMNTEHTTHWARQAVTHLLQRLTARAARELEAQAGELLEAARVLRGGA